MALDCGDHFWYFGYGSNMSACLLHMKNIEVEETFKVVLRGWRLSFSLHSKSRLEPSYANLQPAEDGDDMKEVHGLLHRLNPGMMSKMDSLENCPDSYERIKVPVEVTAGEHEGKVVEAWAYSIPRGKRHPLDPDMELFLERPPSTRYKRIMVKAAEDAGLCGKYVAWLKGHKSADPPEVAVTPEQKAALYGKAMSEEELAALKATEEPSDTVSAADIVARTKERTGGIYSVLRGYVFDMANGMVPPGYKLMFAGKDMTMIWATRYGEGVVKELVDITKAQAAYIDGALVDLMETAVIVGHVPSMVEKYEAHWRAIGAPPINFL